MAKHEIIIRENTSATSTNAPYLGTYVKKGDLTGDNLYAAIAKEAGVSGTVARSVIEGAFEYFEEAELEAANIYHVDGMTICLTLKGSFVSSDAEFDPNSNSLEIAIRPDDDIKNCLINETPTIVTDETATKVRITSVYDKEDPRPYEVIYGLRQFSIQGVNIVMTDAGASVTMVDEKNGTSYDVDVKSGSTKQVADCCLKQLANGGDYKVYVKSRGGDAEGPLQTVFRKVKYIKAVPTVTGIKINDWMIEDGGTTNAILGTNLPNAGYRVINPVNKIVVKFTKPGAATETSVEIDALDSTTSKEVNFQPANIWEALSDVTTGATMNATYELLNGTTVLGTATGTITKGAE